jgi:NADH-quinone oxidoreductase subunit G
VTDTQNKPAEAPATTTILIDGVEYEAPLGMRLLDYLTEIGKDIPHFCYHPGLPVDASCRQCQVESKGKSSKPGMIVACRESIIPEMVIHTDSEAAKKARQGVMEFLLVNHPLDCPICDKAGECTLQDNAYETGQGEGRSHEERRKLPKRKSLGDKILLDNERCILCRRCIRFFTHVTGEAQLIVTDRGDRSVLTTFMDEPLHGDYQGNIVDVCPVGALTLKKFRFESRVWFLHETKSVCGLCSKGCNTTVDVRDNEVLRIRPRHNPDVNGYWMCDEGRLTFDCVNTKPEDGRFVIPTVGGNEVQLSEALAALRSEVEGKKQATLVLSPFATLEEGAAFQALAKAWESAGIQVQARFLQPDPSGRGDKILRTDEPAPNCRGLRELGIEAIRPSELSNASNLVMIGFGQDRLLHESALFQDESILFWQAHGCHGLPKAKVVVPVRTIFEKNGYWVNEAGQKQYVRASLKPPMTTPDDLELLAQLTSLFADAAEGAQA